MTASPEVYAILCLCKGTQAESAYAESAQESTLRGFRREVSPDLLRRTEMKSKSGAQCGSAPRDPPGERVRPVAAATEMLCTAEKVSVFGAKDVRQLSARHDSNFGFPSEGNPIKNRLIHGDMISRE